MTLSPSSLFNPFSRKLPRRVLWLSNGKLCAHHWLSGKLVETFLFDTDDEGVTYFKRYLQELPNLPTYFIVDLAQEEFRTDTVPHIFGQDKKALIARKARRYFPRASHYHDEHLARLDNKRRDDQILLSALTDDELTKPWLALIEQNKTPLIGIYSVPHLTYLLLPLMPTRADYTLIAAIGSVSGLRLSLFINQKLKISRLTSLAYTLQENPDSLASTVMDEIQKMVRYLSSMRLVPAEFTPVTFILSHGDLLTSMMGWPLSQSKIVLVDLAGLAGKLRLDYEPWSSPFVDRILLSLFFINSVRNVYATPQENRYSRIEKTRILAHSAAFYFLLGALTYSGYMVLEAYELKQDELLHHGIAEHFERRHQDKAATLPKTPVNPEELKQIVDLANTVKLKRFDPLPMLKSVSVVLDHHPRIILQSLQFRSPRAHAVTVRVSSTAKPNNGKQQLSLIATINKISGNYRGAVEIISSFVEALEKDTQIKSVIVVSQPISIDASTALSGESIKLKGDARFELVLTFKDHG